MKKIIISMQFILSCLLLSCLHTMYYGASFYSTNENYNIFTLILVICITYIFHKSHKNCHTLQKRKSIFTVLGIIYGVFFVAGAHIFIKGNIEFSSPFFWVCIVVFSIFFHSLIIYIYTVGIPWVKQVLLSTSNPTLNALLDKVSFVHLWIFIFICWIPTLLACYPGIFSYDAIYQCSQVGDTLNLTSHHPIIHTLLLGYCVHFGRSVLSSANSGLFIYSLIQMLIHSAALAYTCSVLKRYRINSKVLALCIVFYAFMPFHSIFAICTTKDTIFSSLFLLVVVLLCKMVIDTPAFYSNWKLPISFILAVFGTLIFRNNMLYAFVVCIPFFLVIFFKYRKKCIILMLLPIVLLKLYEGILFPALDVAPGNSREKYSVFMQQYASIYNYCEMENEDREMLLNLMSDEAWRKYEPHRTDVIKDHFNTEVFESNFTEYIKLWIKLGIQHPSQYVNAFLNLTYHYWYPSDILPDTTTYRKYIEIYTGSDITFDSKAPWLLDKIIAFGMDSSYQNIPGISIIFSPAIYLWILLYLCAVHIYEKKYRLFIVLLVPIAFFLTMLLGPLAILRYLYPIILCTPVICALRNRFEH